MASTSDALQIATGHHEAGNLREAELIYRQILAVEPRHSIALHQLGLVAHQVGQHQMAIDYISQAIALQGNQPVFHSNLAEAYRALGKLNEANQCLRQAIRLDPNLAEAHYNLGILMAQRCQLDEAADAFREALSIRPNYADALLNCARLSQVRGQLDDAANYFEQLIALQPGSAPAHFELAAVYQGKGMARKAIATYEKAVQLDPNYATHAYNNITVILNDQGKPDAAMDSARKGLELAPDHGLLHANLATALHNQGRGDEAIAERLKVVDLCPLDAAEHSNYLYALNFQPGVDPQLIFAEHLRWANRHAEPLTAKLLPHTNDATPQRRLRIGYISPFFRRHAVTYFTEPILASHDHEQFEIFCYSDARSLGDVTTARLKSASDHWREVNYQSDEQIASLVREDRIDIFVDLTGHIGGNRLLAFARKPAPVQVTYLGYQNTTGMSAMDYRLTDELADPSGLTDALHTENLVRLPRAFFCYRPGDEPPSVSPLPALANGYLTFGAFNNFAKVTPQVIDAWLSILQRVPQSRLLVLAYTGGYVEQHLKALAVERGIEPERIELCDKRPHPDYMALVARADIGLDPFPFNGHTTTCDSIWMGVPVVALQGQTYASRFGGSVLANVGLESLITHSVEQYIETAVDLAQDLERLASLRRDLRQRMADSALLDFAGFTRHLEDAYRNIWVQWCKEVAEKSS